MSEASRPQASDSLMPVSLIRAINHLGSSLRLLHSPWIRLMTSLGTGNRSFLLLSSGIKVPLKTLVIARPCSLIAKFIMALTDEKTRLTEDEDIPRSKRKSLNRPASAGSSPLRNIPFASPRFQRPPPMLHKAYVGHLQIKMNIVHMKPSRFSKTHSCITD